MSNKQVIQETLVSMGFVKNYICRALKVFEKNYGHSYNIDVITEIIVRLQNKDNKQLIKNNKPINNSTNLNHSTVPPEITNSKPLKPITNVVNSIPFENNNNTPFISHMSIADALKLKINDKIDHRDEVGRFIQATVIDKKNTNL
eukprot:358628_1